MQWCLDFAKLDYKIVFNPDIEIIHYMGGSNANKNDLMNKNYNQFLKKNYSLIHRKAILLLQQILKIL
jgi:GT2 family glycosyltransferase